MSVLRAIAAAERLHEADDLAALLEPGVDQRAMDDVGEQGIGRDDDVTARHEHAQRRARELREQRLRAQRRRVREHGEARQRTARVPSSLGGMRQTPPRPLRSFRCSPFVYSRNPYGGSVTIA